MCLKKKKKTTKPWVFKWDLSKGGGVSFSVGGHFGNVIFTTREPWKLTRGFKACCGGDHVLWRCLDKHKLEPISPCLPPH